MRQIAFFDYPQIYKRFEEQFDAIFKDVCSRGAFILQNDLIDFENNLAAFLNIGNAYGVADGTNAMILGLQACGIGPGDEVLISSHTYIATAAAIKAVGAEPVFVDIGDDFMFCADDAANKITASTKAVMPTQLNGRCCNMDEVLELSSKYNLSVFEDSAQGLGARFKGKAAGTFGKFGTISFYPAKLMGCFGDGGAVLTDDPEIAEKLFLLRDHGRNSAGEVVDWGTNSRLDNLQAAFLNFRLSHYDEDIQRRRQIARMYDDGFAKCKQIYCPPGPSDGEHFDVYQNYELAAEYRDQLRDWLSERGVKTIIQWAGKPVHHFEKLGYGKSKFATLSKTDWFFERCLMLPMHMGLSDEDVDYIVEQTCAFYNKAN